MNTNPSVDVQIKIDSKYNLYIIAHLGPKKTQAYLFGHKIQVTRLEHRGPVHN